MLKDILDKFYLEYDFKERLLHDPIEFPHRYKKAEDMEISGFIASCLAYGRVDLFKPVIGKILPGMGASPYAFLMEFDAEKHGKFIAFKYRFNETSDIICLLFIIHRLLKEYGSLENVFKKYYKPDDLNTGDGIIGFVNEFMSIKTSKVYGENIHPPGLTQFVSSPAKGSACKRLNLFLRWMIRDKDIDLGIWKGIPKNKLVIPLDTHIARISRCLGFTKRKASDWKTAVEITEALKNLDNDDPLRYDFALCHHGISGRCKAGDVNKCNECALKSLVK